MGGDDELRALQDELMDPSQAREAILRGQSRLRLIEKVEAPFGPNRLIITAKNDSPWDC